MISHDKTLQYYIISYFIISYHTISHHIISYHTTPHHIISHHIRSGPPKPAPATCFYISLYSKYYEIITVSCSLPICCCPQSPIICEAFWERIKLRLYLVSFYSFCRFVAQGIEDYRHFVLV